MIYGGVSRREAFALAGAAAAVGAWPAAAWGHGLDLRGFVVDMRFRRSREAATPAGAWRHLIDGDVTALWYHRLDAEWRSARGAVAGLTGEDALFVLERLAWDRGRRVVLREPVAFGKAPLVRWLIAPKVAG